MKVVTLNTNDFNELDKYIKQVPFEYAFPLYNFIQAKANQPAELFTREDLTKFATYIISDERRLSFEQSDSTTPLEDRLKQIHHADVENFIESLKPKEDA